jgi:hypothetical protein
MHGVCVVLEVNGLDWAIKVIGLDLGPALDGQRTKR